MACTGPANADTELPTIGGTGGGEARSRCPGNLGERFLIGVQAKTGSAVDQINIICAQVVDNGTHRNEASSPRNYGGEGGGKPEDKKCGPGLRIESLAVVTTQMGGVTVAREINFQCVSAKGPAGVVAVGNSTGVFPGPDNRQRCPAGQAAIGLRIRSGLYVDAVGLICHPFQMVAAAPTPGPGTGPGPTTTNPTPPSPLAKSILAYAIERADKEWCVDRQLDTRQKPCPPLAMGRVGDGECTDLVMGALTFVKAKFEASEYDWGREIGRRTPSDSKGLNVNDILPGDIIQTFNAKFVDPGNSNNWTGTNSQHSAIVESNTEWRADRYRAEHLGRL